MKSQTFARMLLCSLFLSFPHSELTAQPEPEPPVRRVGTAFVVNSEGYLVTCQHVLENVEKMKVKLGENVYGAQLIAADPKLDLAIIRISARGLQPLVLGDSKTVEKGQEVRAFGFPLLTGPRDSVSVSRGTVANLAKTDGVNLVLTDMVLNPGNSGGPLVNDFAEVIGVNTMKSQPGAPDKPDNSVTPIGVATIVDDVKKFLRDHSVRFATSVVREEHSGPDLARRIAPSIGWVLATATEEATPPANTPTPPPKGLRAGTLRIPASKELMQTLSGPRREVSAVAYAPDGGHIACGTVAGQLVLWNLKQKAAVRGLSVGATHIRAVAFSPDSTLLACANDDGSVRLCQVETGVEHQSLAAHGQWAYALAFSPDGKTLVSGGYREIKVWDVETGSLKKTLTGVNGMVNALGFSPEGDVLACACGDKKVRLWDAGDWSPKPSLIGHDTDVVSLVFSTDGKTLATADRHCTIMLWDINSRQPRQTFPGNPRYGWLSSLAFCGDGTTLAAGYGDNAIRLWDLATGEVRRTIVGHEDSVSAVAVSPDGRTLASGSSDRTVKLWRIHVAENGN